MSHIYELFCILFRGLNKYQANKYRVWRAKEATIPREMFEPGEPKKPGQSMEVLEPGAVFQFGEVLEYGELKEPAERSWILGS